jgi:hypothetical protein
VVSAVPRRLGRAGRAAPQARAMVLCPLRRQGDRARDQARLRVPVRAHGGGRRGQGAGRAAGIRARTGHGAPLPAASPGAGALAGGRVCVPDAVLLPARRAERLAGSGVRQPRAAPLTAAQDLHHAADVDGPDLRHDLIALRAERRHHRPRPVLAVGHRRRAVGDRADRDRAALVFPRIARASGAVAPQATRAPRRGEKEGRADGRLQRTAPSRRVRNPFIGRAGAAAARPVNTESSWPKESW